MITLHVANGCGPTGRVLEKLLTDQGVKLGPNGDGHVCWGVGVDAGKPTLNGRLARTKLGELQTLSKAGVQTVAFCTGLPPNYPALARMNQHHGGRDIRVCLNRADAERALRDGFGFFTIYVLKQTEYRVWIYRRRHLGTYEKRLEYREKFKRIGGNYANGYAFHLVSSDQVPRAAVELSTRAITALSLDFGAVDVLNDKSGASFVLEVNTAPGVEGDGRTVIQALAVKIANWEKRGYPRRNGDKDD